MDEKCKNQFILNNSNSTKKKRIKLKKSPTISIAPYQYMIQGIHDKSKRNIYLNKDNNDNTNNDNNRNDCSQLSINGKHNKSSNTIKTTLKLSLKPQPFSLNMLPTIPKNRSMFHNFKINLHKPKPLNLQSTIKTSSLKTECNNSHSNVYKSVYKSPSNNEFTNYIANQTNVNEITPLYKLNNQKYLEQEKPNTLVKYMWNKRQELYVFGNKNLSPQNKLLPQIKEKQLNKNKSSFVIRQIGKMQIVPHILWKTVLDSQAMLTEMNDDNNQSYSCLNKKVKIKDSLILLKEIILSYGNTHNEMKENLVMSFFIENKYTNEKLFKRLYIWKFIKYLITTPNKDIDLDKFIQNNKLI